MARVTGFTRGSARTQRHPTETECEYQTVEDDSSRYLQLSTSGSSDRVGKGPTQTLQFDRERAKDLLEIIKETFPGI